MNIKTLFFTFIFTLITSLQFAQVPKNWFLLDSGKDGYTGVSAIRAYDELLNNKNPDTVIVAIIDSGVDHRHDGLKERMWTNPGEIPNSRNDDDGNGYIDDIHGWNFIGGNNFKNVKDDTYEVTRLYVKYHAKFKDADPDQLSRAEKKEYELYLEYKEKVEGEREKAQKQVDFMVNAMGKVTGALIHLEGEFKEGKPFTMENVMAIQPGNNADLAAGKNLALNAFNQGAQPTSFEEFKKDVISNFSEGMRHYKSKVNSHYNPDFDPRNIVGDNYEDSSERFYGNSDSKGPDALHGTHVAGIVGMKAHEDDDIYGVARHVKIMSVRAVPDGDERDKDVANAIRYAVDNGASIINMSFGKGYSWDKQVVDEAVKYAEDNDVLLIHAAGNAGQDNDVEPNFPNARFEKAGCFKPKKAKNWLEVGALSPGLNEIKVARFSNYGKKTVDVFAPGDYIYATTPGNNYQFLQGTSMAAPMVAGVAAILRSYYPELTARQVRDIIMDTSTKSTQKVLKPGTNDMVEFKDLSASGGYINTYEAVKLAEKTKGKKKPTVRAEKSSKSTPEGVPATIQSDENPRS